MNGLTISRRKFFASLQKSKYRRETGLFVVEGDKALKELLESSFLIPRSIIATKGWCHLNSNRLSTVPTIECYEADGDEIGRISGMTTPAEVIGVFEIPASGLPASDVLKDDIVIALDGVQDPGNVGTIIRTADWWGVKHIVCSQFTADCYSPKVVQASMGALGRVRVSRTANLNAFLKEANDLDVPVYGTFLEGVDIFSTPLSNNGVIVMGNEGNGISPDVEPMIGHRLTIPCYPADTQHVESLNVAIATAVTLSCFRFGRH